MAFTRFEYEKSAAITFGLARDAVAVGAIACDVNTNDVIVSTGEKKSQSVVCMCEREQIKSVRSVMP